MIDGTFTITLLIAVFRIELKLRSAVMDEISVNDPLTCIFMLEIKYGTDVGSAVGRADGSTLGDNVGPVG